MIWLIFGMILGIVMASGLTYAVAKQLYPYKERYERLSKAVDAKALDELIPPSDIEALERGDLPRPALPNPTKVSSYKKKPAKRSTRDYKDSSDPFLANLHKISGYERVQIEKKRLKNGLPPRDPLVGLSSYDISQIEKEKIRQGWG